MTAAQGCNDADAGSTGTRNRGRDARTPFRFDSRGEDTFTYVWPLVPCLSAQVATTAINSRQFSNPLSLCSRTIKRIKSILGSVLREFGRPSSVIVFCSCWLKGECLNYLLTSGRLCRALRVEESSYERSIRFWGLRFKRRKVCWGSSLDNSDFLLINCGC